jgi:putative ABC transport system ATP-binding protein
VTKEYVLGKQVVRALRGVDLSIAPGEFAVVAGPSGSGKTTLLNIISCMDSPTAGRVLFDGEDTSHFSEQQFTVLRRHKLGFIFQSFNLMPVLDVYQNVELPLLLKGGLEGAERHQRIVTILEQVGLTKYGRHRPSELSGGQQQRVAIARALVSRPRVVLADEPTANLDSETGHQVIELMRELSRSERTTFIFSTHDPKVMAKAERSIEIVDGRIVHDVAGARPRTHAGGLEGR